MRTTKIFSLLILTLLLIACVYAQAPGQLTQEQAKPYLAAIDQMSESFQKLINECESIGKCRRENSAATPSATPSDTVLDKYVSNAQATLREIREQEKLLSPLTQLQTPQDLKTKLNNLQKDIDDLDTIFNKKVSAPERPPISGGIEKIIQEKLLKEDSLTKIKNEISKLIKGEENGPGLIMLVLSYLPYIFLFILFLTIVGVAWNTKRRVEEVDRRFTASLSQKLSAQSQELFAFREQVAPVVNHHTNELNSLQAMHRQLNTELTALRTQLHTLEQTRTTNGGGAGGGYVPEKPTEPRYRAAAEWLRQIGSRGISAKPAFMLPDALQKAADDEGIYVLASSTQPGVHLVLPNATRFTSSQDFTHYQKFYDCEYPTSGEILILEPAQAKFDPGANQWHLSRKGRIEIG